MAKLPSAFPVSPSTFELAGPPVLPVGGAGVQMHAQTPQQHVNPVQQGVENAAAGVQVLQPLQTAAAPLSDAEFKAWTEQQKRDGEKAFYDALSLEEVKLLTKEEQEHWRRVTGKGGLPKRPKVEEVVDPNICYEMCPQEFEVQHVIKERSANGLSTYNVTGTFTFVMGKAGRPPRPKIVETVERATCASHAIALQLEKRWLVEEPTKYMLVSRQASSESWVQVPEWTEIMKVGYAGD